MLDKQKRGAKITWEIAQEIRRLRSEEKMNYYNIAEQVAERYEIVISYQNVGRIINRELWREP